MTVKVVTGPERDVREVAGPPSRGTEDRSMTSPGKNVIRRMTPTATPATPVRTGEAIPDYIASDVDRETGRIEAAELDRHAEVTNPDRKQRDTVEMEPIVIDALCIASRKHADDIERGTTRRRRNRRPL